MSAVDLGRIDLLVDEGFYSNRTDFVRTAVRKEIDAHGDVVKQTVGRRLSVLGAMTYNRKLLERHREKGERLTIRVVGAVHVSSDVSPELAREAIESIKVWGVFHASPEVKAALADRTA